ncbi:calcium-binding protein [Brevundimonas sp.]|uniref:beta strand repeat-containing protein n=1 Tax=Brevundimonas sp. TaxID=1871086 RepID=UPI002D5F12C4|nr:calcium-binding protein [Brevundimonas sp.]HYC97850.1 calcium-binding protein [Brevundimonas sp.]
MPISYIYNGEPMTGTAADNFFIAYSGSTGTNTNTVNGGDGDDWVMADSSDTWIPSAGFHNDSIADAFNLEALTSPWTTDENPLFGLSGTPHSTAIVEATIGESEYFRVAIGAGQTITLDIDFAFGSAFGPSRDLIVEIYDAGGILLASGDDSNIAQGGLGSFAIAPGSQNSYDPYLTYTATAAGNYYINVRPFGGGPGSTFTANDIFLLNVSVTGHAVSASATVMGADTVNGDAGDDSLFGQGGADLINGGLGNDLIHGGSGVDTVNGGDGADVLYGGEGAEESIHGDGGNDILWSGGEGHYYGDAGDDIVYAGLTSGVNEILDGGTGIDTLDTRTWGGAYTIDLVTGATSFGEQFTNFENATTGNGDDVITGTSGANVIRTNGGTDTIDAGAGDDTLAGGVGNDSLTGGDGLDTADYSAAAGGVHAQLNTNVVSNDGDGGSDTLSGIENLTGSSANDTLIGSGVANVLRGGFGNDTLIGLAGNDALWGGLGANTLQGGTGDDWYVLEAVDSVVEAAGEGTDTVEARIAAYTLGGNVENLVFGGVGAFTGTGNALNNAISGGIGDDVLRGRGGNDALNGGTGVDTADYSLAAAAMKASLASGSASVDGDGGVDTFNSIENLTGSVFNDQLVGAAGANVLRGGLGADTLLGMGGNDVLWGGTGAGNQLQGGIGDDTYVLEVADSVVELAGEGNDTVDVRIAAYNLANHVENLVFGGVGNFTGSGNALNNSLTGGAGSDILSGRGGSDSLNGGAGFDTVDYNLAAAGVTARLDTNLASNDGDGGTDTFSSIECLIGSAFNDLLISGAAGDTLRGGLGADTLLGFGGNDVLMGGQVAANTLQGGLGNDFYVLDASDSVVEFAGEGHDTIESHVGATVMGANVEDMYYVGGGNFTGTGNAINNSITGGAGNDVLKGMGGNDNLFGGSGVDEVRLRGIPANYTITAEGAGYRIVDGVAGRDGSTFVSSIELVRFLGDGTTTVLTYPPPGPAPLEAGDKAAGDAQVLPPLIDDDEPLVLPAIDGAAPWDPAFAPGEAPLPRLFDGGVGRAPLLDLDDPWLEAPVHRPAEPDIWG